MSVDVSLTTPFEVGSSRFLFKSPGSLAMPGGVGILFWDVTPDGERFLLPFRLGRVRPRHTQLCRAGRPS